MRKNGMHFICVSYAFSYCLQKNTWLLNNFTLVRQSKFPSKKTSKVNHRKKTSTRFRDSGRCLLHCACHGKCIFADPLQCPTNAIVLGNATKPSRFPHFWEGAQSPAPATRKHIWTSKSGANMWCFVHFDFEMCFAPQRRALFRHLSTSKSGPKLVCFVHFDLEMCFAPQRRALFRGPNLVCFAHFDFEMCFVPQRRALFRHLSTSKKWSEADVFCTFWLRNVLRATTVCTFSTSLNFQMVRSWCVLYILTWKCASRHNGVHFFVVRTWCVLHILTSKCASRHNGMQFFISHLASWLRTRRFREPTFRPSGATNHWKNAGFCDFPTFSGTWIFFLLTLSPLWSSLFYSSLLSDSSPLCFSSVHTVGSWLLNFLW